MSYHSPIEPAAPMDPPPRHRPGSVSVAAVLMLVAAALGLGYGVATLVASAAVGADVRGNAAGSGATQDQIDMVATLTQVIFVASGLLHLVLAAVVAVLAAGVLRGSNGARITTVVLAILSLCCGFGGASAAVFGNSENLTIQLDGMSRAQGQALGYAVSQAVPDWLAPTGGTLACLQIVGYIAVVVLLLLPVSAAFFRQRPAPPGPVPPGPVPPGPVPPGPVTPPPPPDPGSPGP